MLYTSNIQLHFFAISLLTFKKNLSWQNRGWPGNVVVPVHLPIYFFASVINNTPRGLNLSQQLFSDMDMGVFPFCVRPRPQTERCWSHLSTPNQFKSRLCHVTWSPYYADCSWNLPQRSLCIVAHLSIKHVFIYIFKLTCTQSLYVKILESLFCLQTDTESTKPLQWRTIDDTITPMI